MSRMFLSGTLTTPVHSIAVECKRHLSGRFCRKIDSLQLNCCEMSGRAGLIGFRYIPSKTGWFFVRSKASS